MHYAKKVDYTPLPPYFYGNFPITRGILRDFRFQESAISCCLDEMMGEVT